MISKKFISVLTMFTVVLAGAGASCWTHIAREGETIESLAVRYYGSAGKTPVIRAANGFVHPDNGSLTEGERVEIPETTIYKIRKNDTWEGLADRYLASSKRGPFLSGLNNFKDGTTPPEGTLIKLPYHLRHIFAPRETIKAVARMYLGGDVSIRWLRAYNLTRKKNFRRGDVVIIPLMKLEFVGDEQKRIEGERRFAASHTEVENQQRALEEIGQLREAYNSGRYVKAVAIAGRAIGREGLTVPQEIGINNYLAFTYVALAEEELAIEAFIRAIELQPGMELSPITTSPKILTVFKKAKSQVSPGPAAPGPAAPGPAAPAPTGE